jgi:hypothetical protein
MGETIRKRKGVVEEEGKTSKARRILGRQSRDTYDSQ